MKLKATRRYFITKNNVLFEYEYIGIGYSALSIAKSAVFCGYLGNIIEKYGYTFEPDEDNEAYDWFYDYEEIMEISTASLDEVSELDYLPIERYNQQFYSFFNECFVSVK